MYILYKRKNKNNREKQKTKKKKERNVVIIWENRGDSSAKSGFNKKKMNMEEPIYQFLKKKDYVEEKKNKR